MNRSGDLPIVHRQSMIEEVLAAWSAALGPHQAAYRGHVYRVFNGARAILGSSREDDTLAVVSATHDLGIWSDQTFDYLPPSVARAREVLAASASTLDPDVVVAAIENHHRLRRYRGPREDGDAGSETVEAFRRADLADLSRGYLRGGLGRETYRALVAAFPFAGFHGVIFRKAIGWAVRHPLRPAPMLRM